MKSLTGLRCAMTLKKIIDYIYEKSYIIRLPFIIYEIFRTASNATRIFKKIYIADFKSIPIHNITIGPAPFEYRSDFSDPENIQQRLRAYKMRFGRAINDVPSTPNLDEATTYSKCEWAANYAFFNAGTESDFIKKGYLNKLAFQIASRIEYRRKNTNNHILNNYRALMLLGFLIKNRALVSFGLAGFLFWRERLVSDGFLSEGSTHYQMIYMMWVNDILTFCTAKTKGIEYELKGLEAEIAQNIQYFSPILSCEENIAIGDISPDISFEYVKRYLLEISGNSSTYVRSNFYCEARSEGRIADRPFFIRSPARNIYAAVQCNFRLFASGNRSHHHDDHLGIILFDQKKYYVRDAGRLNYKRNCRISQSQCSPEGHSSVKIKIDGRELSLKLESATASVFRVELIFISDENISMTRQLFFDNESLVILDRFFGLRGKGVHVNYQFITVDPSELGFQFNVSQGLFIGNQYLTDAPVSGEYGQLSVLKRVNYELVGRPVSEWADVTVKLLVRS
jgi:hypothetical protein